VKDVIVTVVVGVVLAIAFMYALLGLAFSGWGPFPTTLALAGRNRVGDYQPL
jgi:hypothetical protein